MHLSENAILVLEYLAEVQDASLDTILSETGLSNQDLYFAMAELVNYNLIAATTRTRH